MTPVEKDFHLVAPLPTRPLLPHLQVLLDKELSVSDKKTQEIFVPTIGGKWKIKK